MSPRRRMLSLRLVLVLFLVHVTKQSIQIELNQLKEKYPELVDYLLNSSSSNETMPTTTTTSRNQNPSNNNSTTTTTTTSNDTTTELIFNSIDRVSIDTHRNSKPTTMSATTSSPVSTARFIYYNNETHSFEGVSMHSTYSVISLGRNNNKTLTLMTTSTSLGTMPPLSTTTTTTSSSSNKETSRPKIVEKISKSILPLYPQFVYSIRVVQRGGNPNGGAAAIESNEYLDLTSLLNEQSQEASKIRFSMIKTLSSQLGLNASELKLNWIDRLVTSKPSTSSNPKDSTPTKQTNSDIYMTTLYPNRTQPNQNEVDYNSPAYSLEGGNGDSELVMETSQERAGSSSEEVAYDDQAGAAPRTSRLSQHSGGHDQIVLVSFSSSRLYDLQRRYLESLKQVSVAGGSGDEVMTKKKTPLLQVHETALNELRQSFETECERFFRFVIKKHETLKFRFKLSVLKTSSASDNSSSSSPSINEYLKKVQFLKLCDLNKIYTLFKNKQYDEANTYVKNSTQEIVFNAVKLTDDYESSSSIVVAAAAAAAPSPSTSASSPSSSASYELNDANNNNNNDDVLDIDDEDDADEDEEVDEEDDEAMLDEYGVTAVGVGVVSSDLVEDVRLKNRLIKLKSDKSASLSNNRTSDQEDDEGVTWSKMLDTHLVSFKAWFWRHVPEEDFLLAVIVPVTIVVALFVLTIVVACLLHMFNKDYRVRRRANQKKAAGSTAAFSLMRDQTGVSTSNTTESTNSGGGGGRSAMATTVMLDSKDNHQRVSTYTTSTLPASHYSSSSGTTNSSSHHNSKSNPIYKQRAYLSKGVPVILYEEMSDKPLEDYDENNASSSGGGGGGGGGSSRNVGNYYRSPYIMRFEKPPMPAPPEYSRESFYEVQQQKSGNKNHVGIGGIGGGCIHGSGDESVLNELRSMLSRDLDTITTTGPITTNPTMTTTITSPDYFIGGGGGGGTTDDGFNKSSPSSSASPAVLDSDDNVHLLGSGGGGGGTNVSHYHSLNPRRTSYSTSGGKTTTAQTTSATTSTNGASTTSTSLLNNTRQSLVNEIFMANARFKQQLSQIADIDLNSRHQLQKLLP